MLRPLSIPNHSTSSSSRMSSQTSHLASPMTPLPRPPNEMIRSRILERIRQALVRAVEEDGRPQQLVAIAGQREHSSDDLSRHDAVH
eukprot:41047-Eustigmatos_ZCMA.PRE.1